MIFGPAPVRIQLRRTKGWRKPGNTIVVARPTKWGNPFLYAALGRDLAVGMYQDMVNGFWRPGTEAARTELAGHNLACWCPLDQPCHADVLLELANA